MKKKLYILYCAVFFAVCLIPFVGMAWQDGSEVVANEVKVQMPEISSDDGFNPEYFDQLTQYIDRNFAGRQTLITINGLLMKNLGESGNEKVIQGKDGWLFFEETAKDYLGQATISRREAFAIAENLQTVKLGVESRGGRFFFTIAPNKNSLYGQYMPSRYVANRSESNYALIEPYLDESYYVDLFDALGSGDEILYHKWDSHWTRAGALAARDALMEAAGKSARDYSDVSSKEQRRHRGDLYEMAFPKSRALDWDTVYDAEPEYTYVRAVNSDDEPLIETRSEKKGSLVMYRDSFGIALLPFMADEYGKAFFSKETPYNLDAAADYMPGDVVIELVERNLAQLCEEAPIMSAPVTKEIPSERKNASEVSGEITLTEEDGYLKIEGSIDEDMVDTESRYWIQVRTADGSQIYAPFYVGESGFVLRLADLTAEDVREVIWYCGDEEAMIKVSKAF